MTDPGVVTPETRDYDPASPNYTPGFACVAHEPGAIVPCTCRRTPRPAPGTPQRGSVDGDSSEVAVALVESAARAMAAADHFSRGPATYVALARAALTAQRVVAYGDQRAAEALREAADQIAAAHADARGAYWTGITRACDDLHTRARQTHGRHAL